MGMLGSLLLLPVKGPMDGAFWVMQKIHGAALEEFNDPATIKRALAALEQALMRDDITEDDYDKAETELLLRLKAIT